MINDYKFLEVLLNIGQYRLNSKNSVLTYYMYICTCTWICFSRLHRDTVIPDLTYSRFLTWDNTLLLEYIYS